LDTVYEGIKLGLHGVSIAVPPCLSSIHSSFCPFHFHPIRIAVPRIFGWLPVSSEQRLIDSSRSYSNSIADARTCAVGQ
jgi:hypothetical protein